MCELDSQTFIKLCKASDFCICSILVLDLSPLYFKSVMELQVKGILIYFLSGIIYAK